MKVGSLSRTTGREVYEDLHRQIVQGILRPGAPLSETSVAGRYGLSRTPVREVFWRLGQDGFLRVVPQAGTWVAPINVAAVHDSGFVREALECAAIPDAARRATAADGAHLQDLVARQAAALARPDFAAFFALDEAMHRHLTGMAGRPFVWQVIAGAKAQLDRVRFLSLADPDWPGMILGQHRAIVDRVLAGDGAGAAAAMRAHLRTAFAAMDRIAAQNPGYLEGLDAPQRIVG